jgi:hypothetical protein
MTLVIRTLALFLAACLFVTPVFGADKAVITYQGKPGIFFEETLATRMLGDLEEYTILKNKKIPEFELKIQSLGFELDLYKQKSTMDEELIIRWQQDYARSELRRVKEVGDLQLKLDRKNSWIQQPATMLLAGLVVGCLLSTGLTFGLKQARE